MCASLVAYSCTRDCERWLQSGSNFSLGLSRFQFCPAVLSPFALPQLSCCLSFGFLHTRARARPREREREGGGESWYMCTRTPRIVLDVARTFADWRLVEITRSPNPRFSSLSLNYSKSNLQASVRNECKNELDVMSD